MAHARSLRGGWEGPSSGVFEVWHRFKAGLQVNPETISRDLKHPHELSHSHWSLATAPQQEADAEASTDTGNKSSQSSSSNAQSAPSETTSASKEKETSAEKGKDSSVRTLPQGPSLYLPPPNVPGGLGSFWPVCPRFQLHARMWKAWVMLGGPSAVL